MADQDTLGSIPNLSFTPLKLVVDAVLDRVIVLVWSFMDPMVVPCFWFLHSSGALHYHSDVIMACMLHKACFRDE